MNLIDIRSTIRRDKNALYPFESRPVPITTICIHHAGGPVADGLPGITAEADYHIDRNKWESLSYHFVVCRNGDVYQANDVAVMTWHASAANPYSIGVELLGDFTAAPPGPVQLTAARELVAYLQAKHGPLKVVGHRDVDATQCPGLAFTPAMVTALGAPMPTTIKLCGHWQSLPGYAREAQDALGSPWVKIMQPSAGPDPFPGRKKCLRWWTDSWDRALIALGASGAVIYMLRMLPQWQALGNWGEMYFELPNEPECNSNTGLAALDAFTRQCIAIANGEGLRLVILNLPEGNPHDNGTGDPEVTAWKVRQLTPCVKAAVEGGHIIGLHGYFNPAAP
jgi:hypothetical protein